MSAATDVQVNAPAVPAGASASRSVWIGRVLSALPVLGLLSSGAMKLSHAAPMVDKWVNTFAWSESLLATVGCLEIAVVVLYVIPRTAVLGAILVTGYLGGAYASHLRIGDAAAVPPLVLGVLAWAGLYLRDARIRALLPLRAKLAP